MDEPAVVVIVGAGPRGLEVLERLVANATERQGRRPLAIHLVDPYPPGPGRVWRSDQSARLLFNSMAVDVTVFTDDSVDCEGPVRPGPSLYEWARLVAADPDSALRPNDPDVAAEVDSLEPESFPTRRLGAEYFAFALEHVLAQVPPHVSVRFVAHRALAVCDDVGPVRHRVVLDGADDLVADALVLTLGHLDAEPTDEQADRAGFATRHRGAYLAPVYGADVDLSMFEPGVDVIASGFGLAFVDLVVLLTEGRGGRFIERDHGQLSYVASGREPRLHVGSRRGVPYRCKPTYGLQGGPLDLPRFFDRASVERLVADADSLDFVADVWPRLAKEVAWGYYQELFGGHPDRVEMAWTRFTDGFTEAEYGSADYQALVSEAVPDALDRLDLLALDRPLAGRRFADLDQLQAHLRQHVRSDIDRRTSARYSADLGGFYAFLSVFPQLPRVLGSAKLPARSLVTGFHEWWWGLFNYYSSGPPPRRLEELLALAEAGVVRFIGADMWVDTDEATGTFRAGSASVADVIQAPAFIDARLPDPTVSRTRDPLLRDLYERGAAAEQVLVDPDGTEFVTGQLRVARDLRVVTADGHPHERIFAIGPHTTSRAPAFVRPRTNGLAFRHNDALARAVLDALDVAEPAPARPAPSPRPAATIGPIS